MTKKAMQEKHRGLARRGWKIGQADRRKGDEALEPYGFSGFGAMTPPDDFEVKVPIGRLVISPRAEDAFTDPSTGEIDHESMVELLERFAQGDYGLASREQQVKNRTALEVGDTVRGVYDAEGGRVIVVSDGDREGTMIVAPGEESWRSHGPR